MHALFAKLLFNAYQSFRTQTFRTQAKTFRTHFRSVRVDTSCMGTYIVPKYIFHTYILHLRYVLWKLNVLSLFGKLTLLDMFLTRDALLT